MDNNYDNLTRLFDRLKTTTFLGRLFGWKKIRNLVIDAAADMQRIVMNSDRTNGDNTEIKNTNADLAREIRTLSEEKFKRDAAIDVIRQQLLDSSREVTELNSNILLAQASAREKQDRIDQLHAEIRIQSEKEERLTRNYQELTAKAAANEQTIADLSSRKTELEIELAGIKNHLEISNSKLEESNILLTQYESREENRQKSHAEQAANLKEIQDHIRESRQKEVDEIHAVAIARLENLKLTWSNHEEEVKRVIKSLCGKHILEYIESVPFKGTPDNTIRIAGEYIIFDAKSPRGDDLRNFPNYIKEQSEKAKKYASEEDVKKWIFFVVPANTLEILVTFVYPLADYQVFVITIDALEPILLSLRKIEEYDFADQMNPEDRENICRVLGKFAHLSKRRIQIDTYFINQFMELAYKAESELPPDILEKVVEFEKAEKLNPPQEKRAKAINLKELEKNTQRLRDDASTKGILIEDGKISTGLNELPLYKPDVEA